MKHILHASILSASIMLARLGANETVPANPLIDYPGFRKDVAAVQPIRESRRLTEEEFLKTMAEPDVVVLDARSGPMFERLHLAGAINLSFPDFNETSLAKVIPTKETRVLIYCNNNFLGSPVAMTTKTAPASLNLSTFVALYSYGYRNVYELGPLLEVGKTRLPLAGAERQRPETASTDAGGGLSVGPRILRTGSVDVR